MNYYKIDEQTLFYLLCDSAVLSALEEAGVDNWLYYDEARKDFWDSFCVENPEVKQYTTHPNWNCFEAEAIAKMELQNFEKIQEISND